MTTIIPDYIDLNYFIDRLKDDESLQDIEIFSQAILDICIEDGVEVEAGTSFYEIADAIYNVYNDTVLE